MLPASIGHLGGGAHSTVPSLTPSRASKSGQSQKHPASTLDLTPTPTPTPVGTGKEKNF